MLRAYIDDSKHIRQPGIAGGVYTLCGYVGEASKWEAFADDWDKALREPPRPLEYLKPFRLMASMIPRACSMAGRHKNGTTNSYPSRRL